MVADELSFMPIPMGGEFSHVLDIFGYGLCSRTRSDHMRTSWCLFWTLHYTYLNTCSMICGMGMDEIETKHKQSVVETINDTGHDNPQVTLARCWWMDPSVRTAPWPKLGLSESLLKRPKTMCGWQPGSSCWRNQPALIFFIFLYNYKKKPYTIQMGWYGKWLHSNFQQRLLQVNSCTETAIVALMKVRIWPIIDEMVGLVNAQQPQHRPFCPCFSC